MTGSPEGGAYVQFDLTTARRYQMALDVNANAQSAPVSYLLVAMTNGGYAQLDLSRTGMAIYSPGAPPRTSSSGLSTGWHRLSWLVDFNDGGTRLEVDGSAFISEANGPIGVSNATGQATVRVGYPFRGDFDTTVQTLFDDVLVTP